MKRIALKCLLILSIGLFSACEYEPVEGEFGGENPTDPVEPAVFEVKVDGTLFVGEQVEGSLNEDGLQIAAQTGTEAFAIQVYNPQVGTFDFSIETNGLFIYTPDITSEEFTYQLSSGTITITEINATDNTVSGSFSGILSEWLGAAEDIVLTEGIFVNVPFAADAPSDFATAMINEVAFNANTFATAETGNTIALNFLNNTSEVIVLNLPLGNITVGEHTISSTGGEYTATYSFMEGTESFSYSSIADSGSINITSYENGIITGTFAFDAAPMGATEPIISITQGEFSIDVN